MHNNQLHWAQALCCAAAIELCGEFGANNGCVTPRPMGIGIDVMVAVALVYFLITCGILLVKLRALNSLPYDRYQGAIVFYRLQVSYCLKVIAVFCCTGYAPVTSAVVWDLVHFVCPST